MALQTSATLAQGYRAAKEDIALRDASAAGGRLRLQGKDALDLLHRLSSNDLLALEPWRWAPTVLTNSKGRVLDHLRVHRLPDHLLVYTGPGNAPKVAEWIDLYTFLEESTVADVTAETGVLQLLGPQTPAFLGSINGGLRAVEHGAVAEARLEDTSVMVSRDDSLGVPAYDLIAPAAGIAHLEALLLDRGQPWGLCPIGDEVFEALRIQAGVPLYGKEMSEQVNPLEAGLRPSISFTKGCYIGQEVVLRLDTYRKVQRHLVRLELEGEGAPPSRAAIAVDGKTVGSVTSAAAAPTGGKVVALGMVRAAHDKAGQQVEVTAGDRRWSGCLFSLEQYAREGTGR